MAAEIGDNSEAKDERLELLMQRLDNLEEEAKGIRDDIKDVYAEGKGVGYDTKMMREVRRLRKMGADDRAEFEALRETYMIAIGLA